MGVVMLTVISKPSFSSLTFSFTFCFPIKYRTELSAVLSRDEHQDIVNRLNMTLSAYWPCGLVYYTGYILVPCTLGLSLLCPMMCVSDAELHAARLLENLRYVHYLNLTSDEGLFTIDYSVHFLESMV